MSGGFTCGAGPLAGSTVASISRGQLQHEQNDARHERVDDRTRIGGQAPHNVMRPAEENLVDALLCPSDACRALDSARAHGVTDRVTHLPGDRLTSLVHLDSSIRAVEWMPFVCPPL